MIGFFDDFSKRKFLGKGKLLQVRHGIFFLLKGYDSSSLLLFRRDALMAF